MFAVLDRPGVEAPPAGPQVTGDPVAVIREQLAVLGAEDRAGWSGPAQTERAAQLTRLAGEVEVEAARAAGVWQASGAWCADGSRGPVASLAWHSGRARPVALRVLNLGALMIAHPATGRAVVAGRVGIDQATMLARALTKDRAEVYGDYEQAFIDQANRLDHGQYRKLLDAWCEAVDDHLDKTNEADQYERRDLTASPLLDGLAHLTGTLDPELAALVHKVFEVFDTPDPDDQPGGARTPGQRRHAALAAALRAALASGDKTAQARWAIDVIVSYGLLTGALPRTDHPDSDEFADDLANLRTEIPGVGVVPPSFLRRLAAHSPLGRIIATAHGLPLDVGQRARWFNRTMRRALLFRDTTCVWPGCDLPGEWCDMDHIVQASRHGPTAVWNGRLLCRRHHHLRDKGWTIHADPHTGTTAVTSPHGLTYHAGPDPPGG